MLGLKHFAAVSTAILLAGCSGSDSQGMPDQLRALSTQELGLVCGGHTRITGDGIFETVTGTDDGKVDEVAELYAVSNMWVVMAVKSGAEGDLPPKVQRLLANLDSESADFCATGGAVLFALMPAEARADYRREVEAELAEKFAAPAVE